MKNLLLTLQIITFLVGIWFMVLGSDHYWSNDGPGRMLIAGAILFSAALISLSNNKPK